MIPEGGQLDSILVFAPTTPKGVRVGFEFESGCRGSVQVGFESTMCNLGVPDREGLDPGGTEKLSTSGSRFPLPLRVESILPWCVQLRCWRSREGFIMHCF